MKTFEQYLAETSLMQMARRGVASVGKYSPSRFDVREYVKEKVDLLQQKLEQHGSVERKTCRTEPWANREYLVYEGKTAVYPSYPQLSSRQEMTREQFSELTTYCARKYVENRAFMSGDMLGRFDTIDELVEFVTQNR